MQTKQKRGEKKKEGENESIRKKIHTHTDKKR